MDYSRTNRGNGFGAYIIYACDFYDVFNWFLLVWAPVRLTMMTVRHEMGLGHLDLGIFLGIETEILSQNMLLGSMYALGWIKFLDKHSFSTQLTVQASPGC